MKPLQDLPLNDKAEGSPEEPSGMYIVPHPYIRDYFLWIVFSDGLGWEHLSVSLKKFVSKRQRTVKEVGRCPTWEEMCLIKDLFWLPEECVVQYHPPRSRYVNNHKWCLHLWKPIKSALPMPDAILVGIKDELLEQAIAGKLNRME